MEVDVFLEIATPPAAAGGVEGAYSRALALVRAADRAGFGAAWLAEHHFLGDYSNAAAPEMLLAAMARETQRIGLGFAVVPLPLHDPLRVAERLATLDILSNGRALWGVGRGVTALELEAFGATPARSREEFRARYDELVGVLRTGEILRNGKLLRLRPAPDSRLARGWMAAVSPESYALAAELGLDVMAGPFKPWAWVKRDFARYRRLRPHGRTSFTLACYCEADHRAARTRAGPGIVWAFEHLLEVTRPLLRQRTAGYEYYRRFGFASMILEKTLSLSTLELMGLAAVGDPPHVAAKLAQLEAAGVDRVQLLIGGGDLSAGELEGCVELIAARVIPLLAGERRGAPAKATA